MATTYLAPGVYVEEVPSTQQPIAGVGTNTVGFIGVVPNFIRRPVPNDLYDPHLAAVLAREPITDDERKARDAARAQLDALKTEWNRRDKETNAAAAEVLRLEAEGKRLDDAIKARDAELSRPAPDGTPAPAPKKKTVDERRQELEIQKEANNEQLVEARKRTSGATDDDFLLPYRLTTDTITTPVAATKLCTNFTEYTDRFGTFSLGASTDATPDRLRPAKYNDEFDGHRALTHAVNGFFKNGGTRCFVARITDANDGAQLDRAFRAFESIDEVAIVAAPGLTGPNTWQKLVAHCEDTKDRFAILDSDRDVEDSGGDLAVTRLNYGPPEKDADGKELPVVMPQPNRNSAFYFPWIEVFDPAKQLRDADVRLGIGPADRGKVYIPPSGHVAGVYARVDAQRGVHKAPANEALIGVNNVRYYISQRKQDLLNPQGVNCIRNINGNISVYGGRTVGGDRNLEWKYVNVRRVMLFLKESIDEGTQWVVFEPNDPSLWAKIRRNVSAFLTNVWRSGALFGVTPQQAFYVKCDEETNPPEVRDIGQVVVEVGVAIVRPAEFVVFKITQWAGPTKS